MLMRAGIVGGAVLGLTTSHAPSTVFAAETDVATTVDAAQKKIRPSDLPIYGAPEPVRVEPVAEWDTAFHRSVTGARKWTFTYLDSIQETTNRVKSFCTTAKVHSADFVAYIQHDSSVLPRATIITVSGLGGIVAGYRGGVLKKGLLSAVAMTTAAAVCYPHQAGDLGRRGMELAADFTNVTYNGLFGSSSGKKRSSSSVEMHTMSSPAPEDTVTSKSRDTESKSSSSSAAVAGDPGMSKAEDSDMYTTRDEH